MSLKTSKRNLDSSWVTLIEVQQDEIIVKMGVSDQGDPYQIEIIKTELTLPLPEQYRKF